MREALTRSQLNAARRLLDRGLALREIAERIDARFEAVCLGLFGGNQSSRRDDDGIPDAAGEPDLRGAGGADGVADDSRAGASPAVPATTESEPFGLRQEGGAPPAPEPAGAAEPQDEPAEPSIEPPPGQRFRLVSEHGESLHENGRVLTRMPRFFWRGDAGDVAMLKAQRPQWARLRAVAVLS